MASITLSTVLTSSPTYGDWPLTWLSVGHAVRAITLNGGSVVNSNSRNKAVIPEEITLGRFQLRQTPTDPWTQSKYT